MRRFVILAVVAVGVLALPGSAAATHGTGDCSYTTGPTSANVGDDPATTPDREGLTVYAEATPNGSGSSGVADVAAGACLNDTPSGGQTVSGFEGGTAECGAGTDGAVSNNGQYCVVDGDNANAVSGAGGQDDGYIGASNYETGTHDPNSTHNPADPQARDGCSDQGTGSNSGGCIGSAPNTVANTPDDTVPGPVPTPICGNTSGNEWDNTTRDGCETP